MKKALLLVLTHAALLSAGYGVHRMAKATQAEHMAPAGKKAAVPRRAPASPATAGTAVGIRAGEERQALAAIRSSHLNDHQKRMLRDEILRDWMARDPHAALRALADEGTIGFGEMGQLLTAEVMKGREEEMLGWILNGDFGLDGAEILRTWIGRTGANDFALLLRLLRKLPAEFQDNALGGLFSRSIDPMLVDERIAMLPLIEDERVRILAWKAALADAAAAQSGEGMDPARFLSLLNRPDLPPEARGAGLEHFARGLMSNKSPVEAMKHYSMLAPGDQASMAGDLLEAARGHGVFNSSAYISALTMVSGSGQWDVLAEKGPKLIDAMYDRHPGTAASASRWAQDLPPRAEVVPTYRRIVGGLFKQNGAEQATAWIEALPEGWHKDQAYAQLAITAEHHYKSPDQRDAAIAQVTDAGIRADLNVWRENRKKK